MISPFNKENIDYICKLMFESFQIPAHYINEKNEIEVEYPSSQTPNPLYASKIELMSQLHNWEEASSIPIIKTNNMETFFAVVLKNDEVYKGVIIVGPTIESELSEELIELFLNDLSVAKDLRQAIHHYYKSLPVYSKMRIIYASMQLNYLIYQQILDPAVILNHNRQEGNDPVKVKELNFNISKRREKNTFHHDILFEKRLLQSIQDGKKEEIIKKWQSLPKGEEFGILSRKSQLRNKKNLGISAITLATRAAIKGGLHYEIAYTLSDMFIQNIEELKTVNEVDRFTDDVLVEFAERVRKTKVQQYSKPINSCLNYIFKHLYEDISLSELAEAVSLHPNYLSSLFKKETGVSIRDYIQKAKIDEAKSLLTFSNYSITKVSTLLNFYDQSYFTKVFKKVTGVTPKQYKNNKVAVNKDSHPFNEEEM